MSDDLSHIALHKDRASIVADATRTVVNDLGADSALAAAADPEAGSFTMCETQGISDRRLQELRVRTGRGLGGQVAASGAPASTHDYVTDTVITDDYRDVVAREGLHATACVPVYGPDGIEVLLYAGSHDIGAVGDREVDRLQQIAAVASIGLYHAAARARERELVILRERQRIAQDVHDSVAQSLFAIGVSADSALQDTGSDRIVQALEEIGAAAAQARSELRAALNELSRSPEPVRFELLFEAEARRFESRTGGRVWLTRHGEPRNVGAGEQLLLDVLREGLANAGKHANGTTVLAHVGYGPEHVRLSVQSECADAATAARTPIAPGSGLGILRDRVRDHGGTMQFTASDRTAILRVELIG